MDWYTVSVAIICLIILLIANIYFLANNAHPNDSPFGQNIIMRILVVFGFTLSYLPILMVPLDIANSQADGGINMELLWFIILVTQCSFVWGLFPICIVYYESNEQDNLRKKCKRAMQVFIPTFIFLLILTVPTYFFLSEYEIPIQDAKEIGIHVTQEEIKQGYHKGSLSFVNHLIGVMAFIGAIFFCFFGGVGFVSLPYDLIYQYVFKPQPIEEREFTQRKSILLNYSLKLREMGKQIENERQYVALIKGFSGWKKRRTFNKKVRIYESRSLLAEKEYRLLDMQANYAQKVEPLKYTLKLVLGIICALLTLNWFAQIILEILLVLKVGQSFLRLSYLNSIMIILIDNKVSIIGSIIFIIMAFYLLVISVYGNFTYGYRTACFTFYPITENETQLNSFMFNAMLMNVLTTYIVQFTCEQLNSLVQSAYFYQLIVKTKYCTFFYVFSQYGVFSFFIMFVSIITMITLLIRGGRRINFSELEGSMKGKNGKNKSKSKQKDKKSTSKNGKYKDMEKGNGGKNSKKNDKKASTMIQHDDDDDDEDDDSNDDD
eukprot:403366747